MKTKLKRSLFIGLGGSGAEAILHTKRKYMDSYGEIPPMVGFLSIDTDQGARNIELKDNHGEPVTFDGSEFIYTQVTRPTDAYERKKDTLFQWFPEENVKLMLKMVQGAGQIRSNGRFSLFFNYNIIMNAIRSKVDQILAAKIIENSKFEAIGNNIEINFVFSVSGGTGSGIFLDIAYLVKKVIGNQEGVKIIGVIILPDIFKKMGMGPAMRNIIPNGYGALVDLDFLMHLDPNSAVLTITHEDEEIQIKNPPFDIVFTVNNINKDGLTYEDIHELCEMIGLALYIGAGELGSKATSAYDNLETAAAGGALDVEGKKAWANGLGLSELCYDGNKLSKIYTYKAIKSIIRKLLNGVDEISPIVNKFIDDTEIRENDGYDFVIDSLLSSSPRIPLYLDESSIDEVKQSIHSYLDQIERSSKDEIQKNYDIKIKKTQQELRSFLIKRINDANGIGNAIEIINLLKDQINIFKGEMEVEKKETEEKKPNLDNQINHEVSELQDLMTSIWASVKKNKVQEKKETVQFLVNEMAININEWLRRDWAIKFFNNLINCIDEYKHNFDRLYEKVFAIGEKAISRAQQIQNNLDEHSRTCVIDIHKKYVNSIEVDGTSLKIDVFIESIPFEEKLFDLANVDEKKISELFWEHSKKLEKAQEWRNKSIDDIINSLSIEEIKDLLTQMVEKSVPLWKYNFKGYKLRPILHESFIVGVPDREKTRIKNDKIFEEILKPDQKYEFVSTRAKDRIVLYRMEAAVPIYAINDMIGYEEPYKISKVNHHIDATWQLRMKREGFSIYPKVADDKEFIEAWTLGFVYEFIKCEDEKYKIYSPLKGDALENYWTIIGDYRDDAYKEFKRLSLFEELKDLINNRIHKIGAEKNSRILKNVKEETNYRDKASQHNLSKDQLNDPRNKGVKDLLRKEIDYIKKEL